ncbi:hypothetical protein GCM10008949_46560 [Deinococcus humi]|nr:hypothetical protein GCM10008949_46560 [Deinococcus humi]
MVEDALGSPSGPLPSLTTLHTSCVVDVASVAVPLKNEATTLVVTCGVVPGMAISVRDRKTSPTIVVG